MTGPFSAMKKLLQRPAAAAASVDADIGDLLLRVTGFVPAAEYHPFVVSVARRLGLKGWIRHDAAGALIRAEGYERELARLVRALRDDAPPGTRVRSFDPQVITADMPPVGDWFVALVEEPIAYPASATPTVAVADVA